VVRGLDMADTVLANFWCRFSSTIKERENEQLIWTSLFGAKMVIFNLPPEVLMSCNQALVFENLFFFLNFIPQSMQLDPWIFALFTK
jgi:hypothetical protein